MSLEDFCKEKELHKFSKESQARYLIYVKEVEKENRPYYDEMYKQAKEILSKKKK